MRPLRLPHHALNPDRNPQAALFLMDSAPPPSPPGSPPAPPPDLVLYPARKRQLREWLAVLGAAGIPHWVEEDEDAAPGPWRIHVPAAWRSAAERELGAFEVEARSWPPPRPQWEPLGSGFGVSSLVLALALMVFFLIAGPPEGGTVWTRQGAADAAAIVGGAWWRAVTALTLHGDFEHVAGNAVCLFLLGGLACQQFGAGLAWLCILLAGFGGNYLTAQLYRDLHLSVGASTAVFGVVGLLGGVRMLESWRARDFSFNGFWLPPLAALAFLGLMGASPNTDIVAHLLGLACGLPLGFATWPFLAHRDRAWLQGLAGVLAFALLAGAWRLALR